MCPDVDRAPRETIAASRARCCQHSARSHAVTPSMQSSPLLGPPEIPVGRSTRSQTTTSDPPRSDDRPETRSSGTRPPLRPSTRDGHRGAGTAGSQRTDPVSEKHGSIARTAPVRHPWDNAFTGPSTRSPSNTGRTNRLPVRGLRWQVHHLVGTVVDPVVPSTEPKEPTTVTPAEIIYHRRVRLLSLADELGNVSAACRQMGISRTRYYEWREVVAHYGLEALMPKDRRRAAAAQRHADPCRRGPVDPGRDRADDRLPPVRRPARRTRLPDRKTTVQKLLVDHGLGRRAQRVARAAAITAATTGLSTDAARDDEPFGFCHYSPAPGCQVAMDSFYIGNLKGVGKVYQLTAIDVATRWAIMLIVIGPPTAAHTIRFIDHVVRRYRRLGVPVRAVLTDNGPEWIAGGFRAHLATVASPTSASRPAHRTTTRSANGSTAPPCRNAGGPPSTVAASPASASSKPKPTPGSCTTTTAAATTATTCAAAHPPRSSTTTVPAKHHDHQPQGPPPVTSTPGRKAGGPWFCPSAR